MCVLAMQKFANGDVRGLCSLPGNSNNSNYNINSNHNITTRKPQVCSVLLLACLHVCILPIYVCMVED